ncbi:MAG: hypothetical protein ACK4XJ_05150 [Fimbriimonadaceae bacterium]
MESILNVPPYFPEPLTVPQNVADAPYDARLRFIRLVIVGYVLSVGAVVAVALSSIPGRPGPVAITGLAATLLALSMIRIATRLKPVEQVLSAVLTPALVYFGGLVARDAIAHGAPIWVIGAFAAYALLYVALAGRDFSFLGLYLVAVGATVVTAFGLAGRLGWPGAFVGWSVVAAVGFGFYFVYDFAMLLTRRRRYEVWAAVLDLYRDVLNILTYSIRVYRHWRRFPVWEWTRRPS